MTVATIDPAPLSGRRKAAVALVALGPERASALLKGLDEAEVTELAREIADLGPVTADEVRAKQDALDEDRAAIETALGGVRSRQERLKRLERGRDALRDADDDERLED